MAETLTRGLQATASLIQSLSGEIRDSSVALATFSADLKNLRETVSLLSKILKDGNGEDSLLTRMRLAERWIADTKEALKEISVQMKKMEDDARGSVKEDLQSTKEDRRQRLQFWGTIIAAILALAGSAVAYFK